MKPSIRSFVSVRTHAARMAAVTAFVGVGAVLAGCPIYPDDGTSSTSGGGCYGSGCGPTTTTCDTGYDCPNGYSCVNRQCVSNTPTCSAPKDCTTGSTCGSDGHCHPGNCETWGCVSGSTCTLAGGVPQCVSNGGPAPGVDGGDAGPPAECNTDSTCATKLGAGAKCLNGSCVAPTDQCNDATQCPGTEQCVDGVCTPGCDTTHPCPTGYACDARGVCTGNPNPCTTSAQCTGGNVCVEGHCASPCGSGCGTGLVCTSGGCIPDQKPVFVCSQEGVQDACAKGSICLHHSCYIACSSADGGADAGNQCKSADKFNVCKSVPTSSGTYSVCGSTSNLGTECDPTLNKSCAAGKVCIDGYCR